MTQTLFDLKGKIALVTGSSHGLGLTVARGLAKAGATVVLNGRDKLRLDTACSDLRAEGLKASGYAFDVTASSEIEAQLSLIREEIGPIDILVNNAGIQIRAPLEDYKEEDWKRLIDINLTAAFLVSRAVVKDMIRRQRGKIINICSLQSELGRQTITPYAASKGGMKMLTRGMATEWGKHNIQVNGIGPGYFMTEMTQALADNPEFDRWLKARTPAGRWGKPEELVGTAIFLASEASSFINGQIIYVDGGVLACI